MVFLPIDIGGLAAWYDAADASTVTGATPVTQWNDKSGNARHLSHSTAGPDCVAASNLIRFNGGSSSSASGDYLNLPSMTARTVFALFKALHPQTAANRYHALLGHVANSETLYIDLPAGTPASYGIRPKGGLNKVSLNGGGWIAQTTADTTVPVSFTLAGDIIGVEYASDRTSLIYVGGAGNNGGPTWRPNWDLAELLIFSRTLTTAEKEKVEGYLAHRWSRADLLPSGHTYKSAPPGSAASLSPAPAVHGHGAGSPALSAAGTLAVGNAVHGHNATAPVISAVTVNEIAAHRIFQRLGGTADIMLAGSYAGVVPARIEARVLQGTTVVKNWSTLGAASIAAGAWSGTLSGVPQGGMYRLEVRAVGGAGQATAAAGGVNQWGVGDIYGLIGSSSAERWFTIGAGYAPDPLLKVYDNGWAAPGTTGAAAITFGNQAIADGGVPVAIMDYGVGGTKLNQWISSANANYAAFRSALTAVGPIRAVIAVVGMNDARASEIASQASHGANWRTLIGHLRADAGDSNLPVLIWGAQRSAEAGMNDQQFGWMRMAEHDVGQDANVRLAVTTVDLPLATDNLHLSESGMVTAARRMARAAGAILNGTGLEWRGPEASQATRVDDTHSDVTLTHNGGTDFGPASGITGFELSTDDFASLKAVSSAVRQSARVIRLTHASTGSAAAKLRYQYGAAPNVAGAVNDNAALPLPLNPGWTALNVLSGVVLLPGNGALATAGANPVLTAQPAHWLEPVACLHELGGITPGLSAWRLSPPSQVLRAWADGRVISVAG